MAYQGGNIVAAALIMQVCFQIMAQMGSGGYAAYAFPYTFSYMQQQQPNYMNGAAPGGQLGAGSGSTQLSQPAPTTYVSGGAAGGVNPFFEQPASSTAPTTTTPFSQPQAPPTYSMGQPSAGGGVASSTSPPVSQQQQGTPPLNFPPTYNMPAGNAAAPPSPVTVAGPAAGSGQQPAGSGNNVAVPNNNSTNAATPTTVPAPVSGMGNRGGPAAASSSSSTSNPSMAQAATGRVWCVAKPAADDEVLLSNIAYVCGEGGVNCAPIQPGGSCFRPNSLVSHASFVMNLYYHRNQRNWWTCHFNNTGLVVFADPSFGECLYPPQ